MRDFAKQQNKISQTTHAFLSKQQLHSSNIFLIMYIMYNNVDKYHVDKSMHDSNILFLVLCWFQDIQIFSTKYIFVTGS